MDTKKRRCCCKKAAQSADQFPGVAIDIADNEKVTPSTVKERTRTLNNNPRNNGNPG